MFGTHITVGDWQWSACVVNLLAASRRLVGHFKCSNVNLHALGRIQDQLNLKKHHLIQHKPTRWNTSKYMLNCLIEQRQAIYAAEIECQVNSESSAQQWQVAEKVVKVLKLFEEATVQWKSISCLKNSDSKFSDTDIAEDDDEGVQTMKRKMLLSLNTCFASTETTSSMSCLLCRTLDSKLKLFHLRFCSSNTSKAMPYSGICFISINKCSSLFRADWCSFFKKMSFWSCFWWAVNY